MSPAASTGTASQSPIDATAVRRVARAGSPSHQARIRPPSRLARDCIRSSELSFEILNTATNRGTDVAEYEWAERMFAAPEDLGIARPDRAVSSVQHGTRSYLEGQGGEGTSWYQGGGAAKDVAVQGITIYPPTGGVQTQGDAFEPVKIGILIDMDLNQLLADWIDPTILAIEDALNEGVYTRGPDPARDRRRARPAPRELPQGDRGLPLARRAGLRGGARPDDLGQLARAAAHRQRARGRLHRLDRCPPVLVGLLLHRRQRRHPDRGRDVRAVAEGAGHEEGGPVLGAGLVGP